MPYIKRDRRPVFDKKLADLAVLIQSEGELNYCLSRLAGYTLQMETSSPGGSVVSYRDLNAIIGVFECAKTEFYRRVVIPYEEEKCAENGDVF